MQEEHLRKKNTCTSGLRGTKGSSFMVAWWRLGAISTRFQSGSRIVAHRRLDIRVGGAEARWMGTRFMAKWVIVWGAISSYRTYVLASSALFVHGRPRLSTYYNVLPKGRVARRKWEGGRIVGRDSGRGLGDQITGIPLSTGACSAARGEIERRAMAGAPPLDKAQ